MILSESRKAVNVAFYAVSSEPAINTNKFLAFC